MKVLRFKGQHRNQLDRCFAGVAAETDPLNDSICILQLINLLQSIRREA